MNKAIKFPDGKKRCSWCAATQEYTDYHDTEWGIPEKNDRKLFEKICLEGFQSGLSWRTILSKRENFRKAFDNFDFKKMALYTKHDVARLLKDEGIVRHKGKIEAVINNARKIQEIIRTDSSFSAYVWQHKPAANASSETKIAIANTISKDLKKRGWKFVGPTTVYAFMQAAGVVNDHAKGCFAMRTKLL